MAEVIESPLSSLFERADDFEVSESNIMTRDRWAAFHDLFGIVEPGMQIQSNDERGRPHNFFKDEVLMNKSKTTRTSKRVLGSQRSHSTDETG